MKVTCTQLQGSLLNGLVAVKVGVTVGVKVGVGVGVRVGATQQVRALVALEKLAVTATLSL